MVRIYTRGQVPEVAVAEEAGGMTVLWDVKDAADRI
tara:strand:- start:107 stop:214 length:108 start_codon:yes stop_codon:yes gene_type:complete